MDKFRYKLRHTRIIIQTKIIQRKPFFDKTAIICYSTTNYQKMTDLFKESLLPLCNAIFHKVESPTINLLSKTGFRTDLWYYCVYNKIKHLVETLQLLSHSNYEFFIYSDCDIWFLPVKKKKWDAIEDIIKDSIIFMREGETNDVNSGFFIIKKNQIDIAISFFQKVLSIISATEKTSMPHGDQTIINRYIHNINYGYIPNEYVIWGTLIFNKEKALLHHCTCCNDIDDKIKQVSYIKNKFNSQ